MQKGEHKTGNACDLNRLANESIMKNSFQGMILEQCRTTTTSKHDRITVFVQSIGLDAISGLSKDTAVVTYNKPDATLAQSCMDDYVVSRCIPMAIYL